MELHAGPWVSGPGAATGEAPQEIMGLKEKWDRLRRILRIPDDQRLAADEWRDASDGEVRLTRTGKSINGNAGLQNGGLCDLHN